MILFLLLSSSFSSVVSDTRKISNTNKHVFLKKQIFKIPQNQLNHKSDSKNDVTSYRLAFHDASNEIEIKNNDKNLQNGGQDEKDKFFEFAQSTIGIIVLSCSGALIIIVIAVLAIYCRSNGCPSCCRCCSRQNQLATDQYGQVILNNDDDIDYRLDAV